MRASVPLGSYVLVLFICASFLRFLHVCACPSTAAAVRSCFVARFSSSLVKGSVYCLVHRAAPGLVPDAADCGDSKQAISRSFMITSKPPACVLLGQRCSAPRPVCLPRRCWARQAIGGTARRVLLHTPGCHLCSASAHMAATGERPTVNYELVHCVIKEAGKEAAVSTYSQLHSFADGVASPAAPQAKVIDGKAISAEIRVELAEDVKRLQQVTGKVRRLQPAGALLYLSVYC